MHHRTLHCALLLGALAAGAWTATELADDTAAHADAKPAVTVDRPGGLVDRAAKLPPRLPKQASARARAAVAKVTAEPTPSTPAEPQPDPTTEPAPSDEPTEPAPPVELPPPLPPIKVPPLPVPAPIPTPVPVPTPPVVDVPDPLPTNDGADPQLPVPVPAPVVLPELLPVAIGPVPGAEPPAGGVVDQLVAELTAGPDQPICADNPDDARHIDRDALRQLLAGLHDKPTTTASDRSPCRPQMPAVNTTGAGQVKPPPPSAADLIVADLVGSHVPLVLGRLEHARARSTIPAGRHASIEPGPA